MGIAMMEHSYTGTCHCGAVRYRVSGEIEAFYCHCESCRRSSGAPYVAWGRVHSDAFQLTEGRLTEFESTSDVTRGFCSVCGTGITYQHAETVPDLDFLLATLDSPGDVKPTYHIRVVEKLPWVEITDGLPQYSEWRTDVA